MEGFGLMLSGVPGLGGRLVSPGKGVEGGGPPRENPSPSGPPGPGLMLDPNPVLGGIIGGKFIGRGCSMEVGVPEIKNCIKK